MDGVIVSLAVLLLSVMAILLGSSAQHQSFIPEKRPGLIHPSSSIDQYSDNGRSMKSWPPNPLTYRITDRKSRKSKGKGPKRLAKLTAKMKKWPKKRDKKLEEEIFDFDNILIAMENPTPVYDQEFSANGSIPDQIKRRNYNKVLCSRYPSQEIEKDDKKSRCAFGNSKWFVASTEMSHVVASTFHRFQAQMKKEYLLGLAFFDGLHLFD
jgi:hypothetical protein